MTDRTIKFDKLLTKYIEICGIPNHTLMLIIPLNEYEENRNYFNQTNFVNRKNKNENDINTKIIPSFLVKDWILVGEKGIVNL